MLSHLSGEQHKLLLGDVVLLDHYGGVGEGDQVSVEGGGHSAGMLLVDGAESPGVAVHVGHHLRWWQRGKRTREAI